MFVSTKNTVVMGPITLDLGSLSAEELRRLATALQTEARRRLERDRQKPTGAAENPKRKG